MIYNFLRVEGGPQPGPTVGQNLIRTHMADCHGGPPCLWAARAVEEPLCGYLTTSDSADHSRAATIPCPLAEGGPASCG
ncbi:unnamed protein product [Heligmosomoides polygyrus]|uniref:Uncharacterized protein n=1 Tax=Heligmosomoides polygyrus TaxID=6339 RepID=A0A183FYG7_HELPZ|nr:unnamed protein product [Heligmosomoides polygyrus]